MFHVILKALSTPAAKTALVVAGAATGCYLLRRSGGDKKVVEGVARVGNVVTGAAVIATSTAIDTGCLIADTAITAAEVTGNAACKGVETVGYGVGRSARAVLDVTSQAGKAAQSGPIARGVVAGFYAPEAKAQPAEAQADSPEFQAIVAAIVDNGGIANGGIA